MHRVRFEPRAKKELDRLQRADSDRLTLAIRNLGDDPRPPSAVKLTGTKRQLFRIRVGPYRVFYEIRGSELLVLIVRVVKRDEGSYRGI